MTSDPFDALLTSRMRMKCVSLDDAVATSALMTPGISRWLASWPMPFTPAQARRRIIDLRQRAFRGDALPFAITGRSDGKLCGWITVARKDDDRKVASLGFWLGEPYHGHGFMQEAAPIALEAGFEMLAVDRIEAGAQMENAGSFFIMQVCGMAPVGERTVPASARGRDELCYFYEIARNAGKGMGMDEPSYDLAK